MQKGTTCEMELAKNEKKDTYMPLEAHYDSIVDESPNWVDLSLLQLHNVFV